MTKKTIILLCCVMLALAVAVAGCGQQPKGDSGAAPAKDSKEQKFLTIAAGGSSGPYYIIGGAMAKIFNEKLGYNSSVQSTGASVENINLLKTKKVDVAFVMSDVATFAVNGTENFKEGGPVKNISALSGLYPNVVQIITLKDRNIKSVYDLKGKRVSVGAPNSGVEVNARMVLGGHGLSYKDMKVDYLSYSESVEQMKNGNIDAAFVTSGLPNATVIDLMSSRDVQIVPIRKEDIEKMKKEFPFFTALEIPAGMYKNDKPIPTAAIRNILLVRSDMTEDQVYKLTKTYFENMEDLRKAHGAMKEVKLEEAGKDLVVPLHPGAEKYYKEALKK